MAKHNLISHNISLHLITLDIRIERLTEKAFALDRGLVHCGKPPDSIMSHLFFISRDIRCKEILYYILSG